jgi:hypothetical protein
VEHARANARATLLKKARSTRSTRIFALDAGHAHRFARYLQSSKSKLSFSFDRGSHFIMVAFFDALFQSEVGSNPHELPIFKLIFPQN